MKNYLYIIIAVFTLFTLLNCKKENQEKIISDENTQNIQRTIVEIKERMFIGQVNEIYLNTKDYLGKIIKLEGIFKNEEYENKSYCYVIRYGPGGCCGADGYVGFEVKGKQDIILPDHDSWVEAAGILKIDESNRYLYLELITLTVMNTRGVEFVNQ